MVTAHAGRWLCGALAADCAPVLIADPEAGVVAAAHAGWRGALGGVVAAAVEAMVALGAAPARMVAAVGPCIGPASYEVGLEFLDALRRRRRRPTRGSSGRAPAPTSGCSTCRPSCSTGWPPRAWPQRGVDRRATPIRTPTRFFSNRRAVHRGEADYGGGCSRPISASRRDAA